MSQKVIMYAHNACPMVPSVVGMLKGAQVEYEYIDIHKDTEARERVRDINNGYESVPTLVFADGSTLTEPSTGELQTKLESIGYTVPLKAKLLANTPQLIFLAIIAYAVLRFLGVI